MQTSWRTAATTTCCIHDKLSIHHQVLHICLHSVHDHRSTMSQWTHSHRCWRTDTRWKVITSSTQIHLKPWKKHMTPSNTHLGYPANPHDHVVYQRKQRSRRGAITLLFAWWNGDNSQNQYDGYIVCKILNNICRYYTPITFWSPFDNHTTAHINAIFPEEKVTDI